jgi:hypothetical protein
MKGTLFPQDWYANSALTFSSSCHVSLYCRSMFSGVSDKGGGEGGHKQRGGAKKFVAVLFSEYCPCYHQTTSIQGPLGPVPKVSGLKELLCAST